MEPTVLKGPKMATFTAAVETRIVADNGSMCTNFEAGESKKIHYFLFTAAIAAGLVPEEPLEFQEQTETKKPEPKEDVLLVACKTLILRGDPGDFTVGGQPRAASVKKLVDCRFTGQDVKRAFDQAMFEVEQDGDNDTEHSEPSSSTAE